MTDQAHAIVEPLARWLELVGVAVIIAGATLASAAFVRRGWRSGAWRQAYQEFRLNLGRGILLGLELLVGADIIATITSPLTAESVALLGAIVVIRTFLSFSLETEIEGCWPWARAARDAAEENPPETR